MSATLNLSGGLKFGGLDTAPANPVNGVVYYNTTDGVFYSYRGGQWRVLVDDDSILSLLEASNTAFDPTGLFNVTATNVQDAIDQLDSAVGALDQTPSNYTPADPAVVASHLEAIDVAIANSGATTFSDATFRVYDSVDVTKQIAFAAINIATGNTRTITMPDADVNLGDIATNTTGIADLVTLSGVAANSIDLGTFTGTVISDGATIKSALQELETAVENVDLSDYLKKDGTVAITGNIVPDTDNSREFGSSSARFSVLNTAQVGGQNGAINLRATGSLVSDSLTFQSNSHSSGDSTPGIQISTGSNSGAGNSGAVEIETGAASTGVRGAIVLNAPTISVLGDIVPDSALTHDLGAIGNEFAEGHIADLTVDSIAAYDTGTNTIDVTGHIDMGGNAIRDVVDPTNPQDAATKAYVDAAVGSVDLSEYLRHDGTVPMSGSLDMGNNSIVNAVNITTEAPIGDGQVRLTFGSDFAPEFGMYTSSTRRVFGGYDPNTNSGAGRGIFYFDTIGMGMYGINDGIGGGDLAIGNSPDDADANAIQIKGDSSAINLRLPIFAFETLDLGTNPIENVLDPVNAQDAATKNYVDSAIAALPDPIVYQGTWNASTNTPTLDNSDTGATGYLYRVTVAGSVDFGAGAISFEIGDSVVNNGTVWEKWDHSDQVQSVNGQTGAVVLNVADINDVDVTGLANGDVLVYNSGTSTWEASAPAAGYTDEQAQDAVGTILDDGTVGDIDFTYDDGTPLISGVVKNDGITSAKIASAPTLRGAVSRAADLAGGNTVEEQYYNGISLAASQTNTAIVSFTVAHATWAGLEISYKLTEATSNAVRIGTLRVVTDGTNAFANDVSVETAANGLSFSAAINGADLEVRYSSGVNTATMRADVKRFRA